MAAYPRLTPIILKVKRLEMHIISQENEIAHLEQQLSSILAKHKVCSQCSVCFFASNLVFHIWACPCLALHCTKSLVDLGEERRRY